MKGTQLGEFEELVLLAVCTTYPDAYGVSIKNEINETAGRKINLSTAHGALNRLEDKALVTSRFGEATSMRGGKPKKLFTITTLGLKKLQQAKELRETFWSQIPQVVFELHKS
ncbi:MAG: PadR family transcriptional regulator [Cyclobacteriaceae bacterium]